MINTICLNENYSTTKLLTKEKPIIENKTEDKFETVLFLAEGENRKGEGGLRTKGYFKKSYENKPLISIITVVFNGEKYLEQTIQSVINQSYDNVEYIIIDGGSTDGTVDIIKKYEEQIDYWVSEPDKGIYNAMNKGINVCLGEYIAFINADDWYNQNVLCKVAKNINDKVDYIFSNVEIIEEDKSVNTFFPMMHKYKHYIPFCHQGLFVKSVILKEEKFDEQFKVAADYDFIIKLIEQKYSYKYLNISIANFRNGGASNDKSHIYEFFKVAYKHFGLPLAIRAYLSHFRTAVFSRILLK